jgi:hypothetical protein
LYRGCTFWQLDIKSVITNIFTYERNVRNYFSIISKTRLYERILWRNKRKIKKKRQIYLLIISDSFVMLCQYRFVWGIWEHISPEVTWWYLVYESPCNTDGRIYSLSSSDWPYLLTDSASGNTISMKTCSKFSHIHKN